MEPNPKRARRNLSMNPSILRVQGYLPRGGRTKRTKDKHTTSPLVSGILSLMTELVATANSCRTNSVADPNYSVCMTMVKNYDVAGKTDLDIIFTAATVVLGSESAQDKQCAIQFAKSVVLGRRPTSNAAPPNQKQLHKHAKQW